MILIAPLQGWSTSLDETPDPVFSGRMLGDGLAIDPTDAVLHAPCDGEIVTIPASRHAVTMRNDAGAEILVHVGIDTVGLAGEGFELIARQGDRVRAGQPLLRFDLDLLVRRAKSVLTPVIVTDGARFRIARRNQDAAVRVGDFLMELAPADVVAERSSTEPAGETVRRARVAFEHGIHARPAALLVNRTKSFAASVAVLAHGRTANARSIVALMSLGVRHGDEVDIRASGPDAAAAAAALETAIARGDVDTGADAASPPREPHAPVALAPAPPPGRTPILRGVAACRGLAIGRATRIVRAEPQVAEAGTGVGHETAELERACEAVRARLRDLARSDRGAKRDIMLAHLEFLEDPDLAAAARAWIAKGKSAGFAWRQAVRGYAEVLGSMADARMAERVDDLLDLESSVLLALDGPHSQAAPALPEHAIVLAKDLLPSQLAALDAGRIAGICLAEGGPTSHVAILAAAMGVPTLVAAGPAVLEVADGTTLVLDADQATVHVDPDAATLETVRKALAERRERQATERAAAQRECRTADGTRVEIFANVGSLAEAEAAVANGAEGCGLLRTEFLFLDRQAPPDESEQAREYQRIADAFAGRPLVLRTLDIGGDKPIPYLPLPREPNPALGLRGVRTSLWRPDLLRTQLRAVLKVRPSGQCRILLPMVVSAAEVRAVRTVLEEVRSELPDAAPPLVGAMVETPAAAVIADQILQEADFLSVGTNDLTQYTLAMDRGHPELAGQLDALHPAVLRLIGSATQAAVARGRSVAVCGGLAADPLAAPILIGLGVRELSVVPSAVPQLKAVVRTLTIGGCRALASEALEQGSAEAVRALVTRPQPRVFA
ncbi:MAG: phosphoenolpyruvate--protein phosphotransferase [Steroidobacteraceae bacterium]